MSVDIQSFAVVRARFVDDFQRPRYHFLPPANWMNDPNGLIQWQGKLHLFYQYNPHGAYWDTMHWGHAVSDDLIHWQDLPIALAPTPGSPDERGVFSGCAVNHNGVPTLIYTGVRGEHYHIQTQCIATSQDGLLTWGKFAGNPIIAEAPAEANQTRDFRDPFVWQEGSTWYMVLGSRIQDVGGAVFLYRSEDLYHWEYVRPLLVGDIQTDGVIWECPNFFKLGDKWVLIISSHLGNTTGTVLYFVGDFDYADHRFTVISRGVLDYGELYAPLTFLDQQGRRILLGWLRESRPVDQQRHSGWSGVQSIPRVLSLDAHHRLVMTPVPELDTIRGTHHHYTAATLPTTDALAPHSTTLDLEACFTPSDVCGLRVYGSPNERQYSEISYDPAQQHFIVRDVMVNTHHATRVQVRQIPHPLGANETLRLRVLLDGSVLEIIANERTSITHRVYAEHPDHNRLQIVGAKTTLQSLDIYEMPSIWQ